MPDKPPTQSALLPYYGGIPNHRPNNLVRWEEAEDPVTHNKHNIIYHNPALPEKYHINDGWSYQFNSLGYRGEEYNPEAKRHIFACGCSYTYGMGIKWHQTFPYVFKERLAAKEQLPLDQVNLLNFAQQAASNDYIARTVISQCSRVAPDLLLILFTSKERFEFVDNRRIGNVGPWLYNEESLNYYRFYSEEIGMINMLKNMLLVQQFCRLKNIPCLMSVFFYGEFSNPAFIENPIIGTLMAELNWDYITPFSLVDYRCDIGRMCHHPGPLSNLCFGRKFFVFYEKLLKEGKLG